MLLRSCMRMKDKSHLFLTDTHAHLASSKFEGVLDEVIARARERKVGRIVSISCDIEDSRRNLGLAQVHTCVFPTVGIHPTYVHEITSRDWLGEVRELASNPSVAAIGEIGLDYFHPPQDGSPVAEWHRKQRDVFENLLQLALDLSLPVVIHQRESGRDVLEILRRFPGVTAVLHCFTGTPDEAETALAMGHYLSFTGVITYKNAEMVRKSASIVPLDRIMVETDAPYLAPVPFRGKACEPFMVEYTAQALAELRGLSLEEISAVTSANAESFFRFRCPDA